MKKLTLLLGLLCVVASELAYAKKADNFDIVMGGFYSCRLRSEMNPSPLGKTGPTISKTYIEVTKSSIHKSYLKYRPTENPFIMSCLTNSVKHDPKDPFDFKVYILDSAHEKEFMMKFDDYLTYLDQKIAYLRSKNKKLKINLYGHSYGGWMGMQVVKELDHYKFNRLITVDPISKPLCRIKNVIKTALNLLPLIDFDTSKTKICNQFPSDISLSELDHIKDKTGVWFNFYQDKTKALHSSEAPISSVKNEKIDSPHIKIDNHEKVWKKFFALL